DGRSEEIDRRRRKLAEAEVALTPRVAAVAEQERTATRRQEELDELAPRPPAREEQLGRRAAKRARQERGRARRASAGRGAGGPQLSPRELALERTAAELAERSAWLTEALARVEAREVDVADRERHAVAAETRFERQDEELALRVAALDDRDRQLGEQER